MTDDWQWWNWVSYIGGCVFATVVGTWVLRKHNKKRQKFQGMMVTIDNTVELIEWVVEGMVTRTVRTTAALLAFFMICKWAWLTIFGGG